MPRWKLHAISRADRGFHLGFGIDALPVPRSLCELELDDDDYQWLRTWAWALSPSTARRWLTASRAQSTISTSIWVSQMEGIGCLSLLLGAEVARREAREGSVWAPIQERFRPDTRRFLFIQGQPTQQHKDAMESGARRFHLRHVFGLEGTQSYYISVYLQFGFTHKGIARLPFWLAGQGQSEAIAYLLAPDQGSPAFQRLWRALREYRRKNITEHKLRQVLDHSPWVLPGWSDDLVRRAREKLELGTATAERATIDDSQPLPFITEPRLRWEYPAAPEFVTHLSNLAALDLSDDRYHILVGDVAVATLLRLPDGTYDIPEEIRLPCNDAQPIVAVVEESGSPVASYQLTLWEPLEDVTVYDVASGRRLDAWQTPVTLTKAYALLTAPDLEIRPPPSVWRLIARRTRQLSLLQVAWAPEMQILLDERVLWTPHLGEEKRSRPAEPSWTGAIRLYCGAERDIQLGQCVQPVVTGLTKGTVLEYVRLGTRPLNFEPNDTSVQVEGLAITPDVALSKLTFTLGLRCGDESARIQREPDLDIMGAVHFTTQGWEALTVDRPLTVREAMTSPCKFILPIHYTGEAFHELAILEGATFSRRLSQAARPLGRLAGLGAQLELRRGPYNSIDALLCLASEVIDPGVIQAVDHVHDGRLQIRLDHPLDPGPDHQVVCWPIGDLPTIISAEQITVLENTVWQVDYEVSDPSRLVVAVAYAGHRLGAAWPMHLDSVLAALADRESPASLPRTTAALIRWIHLPILRPAYLPAVRDFVRQNAAEALAAWLLDDGLPSGLSFGLVGEEWIAALRRVFRAWYPTPDEARAVVGTLATDAPDHPLLATIRRLLRVDPLLMGRVVSVWFETSRPSSGQGSSAATQLCVLQRHVASLPDDAPDADVARRQSELLEQAATAMQVDLYFLERGIVRRAVATLKGGRLETIDAANLNVALGVAPFREYLGLRVLGEIAGVV